MDTAVYLFLAAKGYINGRVAPILSNGIIDADYYINPVPAGLVLTGIVVSVSITAFSLALVQRLYKHYGTLNMDEIMRLSRERRVNDGACELDTQHSLLQHFSGNVLRHHYTAD